MKWATMKAIIDPEPFGSTVYALCEDAMHVPVENWYGEKYFDGFVAVPTDDGLYCIPYTSSCPEEGYEDLHLEEAFKATADDIIQAAKMLRTSADSLEQLFELYREGK